MGSTKQEQAARRAAIQDLITANRPFFYERMRHHYDRMGLGEWSPRPTPETRAAIKAAEEKSKAAKKIKDIAEKAGIAVEIGDLGVAVHVVDAIEATHNGTAETVTGNWHGNENGFADERAEAASEDIGALVDRISVEAEEEHLLQRQQEEAEDEATVPEHN